jgi:hypothetical protein
MRVKLTVLFLSGLMLAISSAAWADGKKAPSANSQNTTCKIENRKQVEFFPPQVYEFGDLKLKVQSENDVDPQTKRGGANYSVVFDLKAPANYVKRGVTLRVGETFNDTICNYEVSIFLESPSRLVVSSF